MPTSAFLTVAAVRPSRSISILSRTLSLRSWIVHSSWPERLSMTSVSRTRSALPSTLNAFSPPSVSIQKSSPIENIFSRIVYRVGVGPPRSRSRRTGSVLEERGFDLDRERLGDLAGGRDGARHADDRGDRRQH